MKLPHGQLGGAIKKARNYKNLTQEKLAELIGVTTEHVQQLESERRNPSVELLLTIAYTLDMSVDALLTINDARTQELKNMINLGLNHCSVRDMEVAYATIEAMREKEKDEDEREVGNEEKGEQISS